jgi:hypothetical protein
MVAKFEQIVRLLKKQAAAAGARERRKAANEAAKANVKPAQPDGPKDAESGDGHSFGS